MRIIGRIIKWILGIAIVGAIVVGVVAFFAIRAFIMPPSDMFGNVPDEAMAAGMKVEDFPGADENYFAEMDKGLLVKPADGADYPEEIMEIARILNADEPNPEFVRQAAIRGQNMWIVWTGGNDRFWDWAAKNTIGAFDLLKIISSHPSQGYGRYNRFRWNGVINEPCYEQAQGPDPERFGLWLDTRNDECGDDPFADADKYKGVPFGARGENGLEVGSHYGEPTGVLGLRLFPNPDFDAEAAARWDPEKFYTDENYYNDKDLVRPYRVGMSCAFCHLGPNPINPPADVENPTYSELTSNPGAQYYWVNRVFVWNTRPRAEEGVPAPNEHDFLYQLFHTNPMGSLDTSLVSTDYMNNPRTMNAVYETLARLKQAGEIHWERLEGGERDNKQFNDYEAASALNNLYNPQTGEVASMRVLKDGADSVGTLGALNRVYLNIGLFSEEWLLHFRPFAGGQFISPIKIADAQKNSVYWQATESQSLDMAIFFLVTARADKLADTPQGKPFLEKDEDLVAHGGDVFAENCAACHSSKQPEPDPSFGVDLGVCEGGGAGPKYRECWDRYWQWVQSEDYKSKMVAKVKEEGFLDGNYLSTERRVPMDVLKVNACSPTATNALKGDIWDNFSSSTYKTLPPPKEVTVEHPVSGGATSWQSLGNGRGYLRPASLVSLWTSAPYMLNNSVGWEYHFYGPEYYAAPEPKADEAAASTEGTDGSGEGYEDTDPREPYTYADTYCPAINPNDPYMPCVANRVNNFERAIRQMLQPETRSKDTLTETPVPGVIYRTSAPACLKVPPNMTPEIVQSFSGILHRLAPWAVTEEGGVALGPLPKDFPFNALVNTKILPDNDEDISLLSHGWKFAKATPALLGTFKALGGQCSPEQLADPRVQTHAEEVVKEYNTIDAFVGLSKCPDYVVNKGHEFGSDLGDEDRDALIAYLKRL